MANKFVVIVNPSSARGQTGVEFRQILAELEMAFRYPDIKTTEGLQHATQLAAEAVKSGATHLIVVGGDGTINEVVNGLFNKDKKLINDAIELGILPSGSGDDLRRNFGWPKGIRGNIRRLARGVPKLVDIGLLTASDGEGGTLTRYFINVASCGVSAGISGRVQNSKLILGPRAAYFWETIKAVWRYKPKTIRIELDGKSIFYPDCSLIAFANGQFFGGGMHIAPSARIDDGRFDQIAVSSLSPWFFLRHGITVYQGKHIHLPQVSKSKGRIAFVECDGPWPVLIETDGEEAGQLPAKFECIPRILRLTV